jgi:hypothetical protein
MIAAYVFIHVSTEMFESDDGWIMIATYVLMQLCDCF